MDTDVIKNNIIHIWPDAPALFHAAAKDFIRHAIATIKEKQCFTVALSGGETPKSFFDAVVNSAQLTPQIPWQQIKFFFGDERYVAADDAASNYQMAHQHLFSKLAIPEENIYRMPTELNDPQVVAEHYEQTLRKVFNSKENVLPQFDLVYLGLGTNAHTASLMPGSDVVKTYLDATHRTKQISQLVTALWVDELKMYRITLTPAILNNSSRVCFLVNGANKALAVWEVLKGPFQPLQYPAQLIHCVHSETVWFLDQAAAEKLQRTEFENR